MLSSTGSDLEAGEAWDGRSLVEQNCGQARGVAADIVTLVVACAFCFIAGRELVCDFGLLSCRCGCVKLELMHLEPCGEASYVKSILSDVLWNARLFDRWHSETLAAALVGIFFVVMVGALMGGFGKYLRIWSSTCPNSPFRKNLRIM